MNIEVNTTPSAANIQIPVALSPLAPKPAIPAGDCLDPKPELTEPLSEEAYASFKANVHEMLEACGPGACGPGANRNELLVNVITACIEDGINTESWIIGVARGLGFERGHVGSVLTYSSKGRSKTPLWQRDREGRFSLIS